MCYLFPNFCSETGGERKSKGNGKSAVIIEVDKTGKPSEAAEILFLNTTKFTTKFTRHLHIKNFTHSSHL